MSGYTCRAHRAGVALIVLSVCILAAALAARVVWLDSIPGLNGDEAWYGVWAEAALRDRAWGGATPTGNIANPFFLVPLGIAHVAAGPAPWLLRAPAVLAGLGFVAVGFACLRAHFGWAPAAVFLLLAATSPTAIAYARFGWDASETPLAAMIVICCCLSGRHIWAAIALVAAWLVHPANIFLAPIYAGFVSEDLRPWAGRFIGGRLARLLPVLVLAGGTLAALLLALRIGSIMPGAMRLDTFTPARLVSADYWLLLAALFADLFSGVTVYTAIAGAPDCIVAHRIVGAGVLLAALVLLLIGPRDRRASLLLGGLAVSAFAFAVLVGPSQLGPGLERYALFLLAPVLTLVSIALGRVFAGSGSVGVWCAGALGGLALAGLWINHFAPLRLTGGHAHDTFRTAAIEPKVQAARWIAAAPHRCGAVTVWAEGWWLFEPLQYLLFYEPGLTIRRFDGAAPPDLAACDDLIVAFAGRVPDAALAERHIVLLKTIPAASGEPLILLYGAAPP